MTFEGQYLTYAEYQALGGSAIGEMPFNLLELEARRKIDIRTQNRLIDSEEIPEVVKVCMFKLINSIQSYCQATENISSNGNVASENTDGYSISYITPNQISDVVASKSVELEDIIKTYLLGYIYNGEHLMYVGVE
ncbi:MAG: hypothetical protein J6S67_05760 [Methanobrevibacter sp.]|nr:hypothetical protein [Methanobrevibacter sp.]